MEKETFINAIESIEKQIRYDIEISEKLGEVFPNAFSANLLPNNQIISDSFFKVLREEMNDTDNWIKWYCFETDFGNESYRLIARNSDGSKIKMTNASELYDFLNTNKTK